MAIWKKKKTVQSKKKRGLAGLSDWLEVAGLHRPGWGPFPGWVWSLARVGLGLARVGPGLARVGLVTSRLGLGRPVWVWDSPGRVWDPSRAGLGSVPGGFGIRPGQPLPLPSPNWTDTGQTLDRQWKYTGPNWTFLGHARACHWPGWPPHRNLKSTDSGGSLVEKLLRPVVVLDFFWDFVDFC